MRRRAGLIALAAAIVLASVYVGPAFAKPGKAPHGRRNGHHHKRALGHNKFQLQGVVKGVFVAPDTQTASTLTVTVKCGTQTVKQYRTKDLTLTVAPDARIVQNMTDGTSVAITLDKVAVGARVHVGGTINRTDPNALVYIARKIIVQWIPPTPSP